MRSTGQVLLLQWIGGEDVSLVERAGGAYWTRMIKVAPHCARPKRSRHEKSSCIREQNTRLLLTVISRISRYTTRILTKVLYGIRGTHTSSPSGAAPWVENLPYFDIITYIAEPVNLG